MLGGMRAGTVGTVVDPLGSKLADVLLDGTKNRVKDSWLKRESVSSTVIQWGEKKDNLIR